MEEEVEEENKRMVFTAILEYWVLKSNDRTWRGNAAGRSNFVSDCVGRLNDRFDRYLYCLTLSHQFLLNAHTKHFHHYWLSTSISIWYCPRVYSNLLIHNTDQNTTYLLETFSWSSLPYHGAHSLHGRVLLVHIELGHAISHGTFVLELRAQPCASQTLIPLTSIWASKGPPWIPHHPHLANENTSYLNFLKKRNVCVNNEDKDKTRLKIILCLLFVKLHVTDMRMSWASELYTCQHVVLLFYQIIL